MCDARTTAEVRAGENERTGRSNARKYQRMNAVILDGAESGGFPLSLLILSRTRELFLRRFYWCMSGCGYDVNDDNAFSRSAFE